MQPALTVRARYLSAYQVAQSIDRQLGFKDSLSTAYYFSQHPDRAASPDFVEHQRRRAEDMARSADIERGVPFLMPRTAYVNLALVAVALRHVRIALRNPPQPGPRLAAGSHQLRRFVREFAEVADARHGKRPGDGNGRRDPGAPLDPWDAKTSDRDPATDAALQSVEDPDPNNASTSPDGSAKADAKSTRADAARHESAGFRRKGGFFEAGRASANASPGADSKSGQQNGSKDAKEGKDANQSGSSGENSSLGSKLRDALSNLLAKMKPQSKQGGGKPNDSSQSASSKASSKAKSRRAIRNRPARSRPMPAPIRSPKASSSKAARSKLRRARAKDAATISPIRPTARAASASRMATRPRREAAELAAMGKISEIIGKRAANISGEVMVEVSSGKQQLKTQYSQQNATHVEAGGEINRDEVPLAYQQYVQQYFAQVRKHAGAKSKGRRPESTTRPRRLACLSAAHALRARHSCMRCRHLGLGHAGNQT